MLLLAPGTSWCRSTDLHKPPQATLFLTATPDLVPLLPPHSSCPRSLDYHSGSPSSGKSSQICPPTQPLTSHTHQSPYPLCVSHPAALECGDCIWSPPVTPAWPSDVRGWAMPALGLPAFLAWRGWLAQKRPQTSAAPWPQVSAPGAADKGHTHKRMVAAPGAGNKGAARGHHPQQRWPLRAQLPAPSWLPWHILIKCKDFVS